jgi:hypothetical protein
VLPAACTTLVAVEPTGPGSCDVTDVTTWTAWSTSVGCGGGLGLCVPEPEPDAGAEGAEGAGAGGRGEADTGLDDVTGRVLAPPGAIAPPVELTPRLELTPGRDTGTLPPPVETAWVAGRLARRCATGMPGIDAAAPCVPAPLDGSDPSLGAGGPERTWPSTPSPPKLPPRASTASAASTAAGTISAALEAAHR